MKLIKYSGYYNKGGNTCISYDSRGEKLNLSDTVLCINENMQQELCTVYTDSLAYYNSRVPYYWSYPAYILRVCKESNNNINLYNFNSCNEDGTVCDVFGRKLRSGDLVYAISIPLKLTCGLLISDTHIMTEHMQKKRVSEVILINNEQLTQQEIEVKSRIQKGLYASAKSVGVKNVGDIYISGKRLFVYMGSLELTLFVNDNKSKIIYKEPVYFEVSKDVENVTVSQITNRVYINHLCIQRLFTELKYFSKLNCTKFGLDFDLSDLRCIKSNVKGLRYLGHIDLGSSCIFEQNIKYLNADYVIKMRCKFK